MDPSADLAYCSARALLGQLTAGESTSRGLVQTLLTRIAAIDAADSDIALRSVLAVATDALDIAAERDRERAAGALRGPLHGLPVLVKDNIEAVGLPGTAGSLALQSVPVLADAPVVATLRAAGAIVLAATNCSEWANMRSPHSSSGWSAVGGLTANPWSLAHSAGGSSAGSGAALAAGLAPLALGTETDGSIVCPAAVNGVVGLKPTVGLLPVEGIVPISHSQDAPGPMARTVADVQLLWQVLSGASLPRTDAAGLRIAAVPQWRTGHAATDALFDAVLALLRDDRAFAELGVVDVPTTAAEQQADELTVLLTELHDDLAHYLRMRRPDAPVQSIADIVAFNEAHADLELQHFGQEHFVEAIRRGGVTPEALAARERNARWAREVCLDPALARFDLLVSPAYTPAWRHDFAVGHPSIGGRVTTPAAIAGYPILSLPMGLVDGLPVGVALVGRPDSEAALLAAAERIESALGLDANGTWRPPFTPRTAVAARK